MVSAEYEAIRVLYAAWPEIVPEPMAWGSYEAELDIYFLVCRFVELSGDIPDVSDFPALLAKMHKRPESRSPTGLFGFDITSYGGRLPVPYPLGKTWEECLTKCLQTMFDTEEAVQGPDTDMQSLRQRLFSKVVPRLIRPLETDGRVLQPTLCHGDLWDGNASMDASTGEPKVFDPVPLYAHNECEQHPLFIGQHTSRFIELIKLH